MTRLIHPSARLYGALLHLSPPDLRRDFGPEMVMVFADQLTDSLYERGLRGFCRTWLRAAFELAALALRAAAEVNSVRVPFISCVLSAVAFTVQGGHTPEQTVWPSFTAAVVSFLAVQTCATEMLWIALPDGTEEAGTCSKYEA